MLVLENPIQKFNLEVCKKPREHVFNLKKTTSSSHQYSKMIFLCKKTSNENKIYLAEILWQTEKKKSFSLMAHISKQSIQVT
jgi:hypothetical protein